MLKLTHQARLNRSNSHAGLDWLWEVERTPETYGEYHHSHYKPGTLLAVVSLPMAINSDQSSQACGPAEQ